MSIYRALSDHHIPSCKSSMQIGELQPGRCGSDGTFFTIRLSKHRNALPDANISTLDPFDGCIYYVQKTMASTNLMWCHTRVSTNSTHPSQVIHQAWWPGWFAKRCCQGEPVQAPRKEIFASISIYIYIYYVVKAWVCESVSVQNNTVQICDDTHVSCVVAVQ